MNENIFLNKQNTHTEKYREVCTFYVYFLYCLKYDSITTFNTFTTKRCVCVCDVLDCSIGVNTLCLVY